MTASRHMPRTPRLLALLAGLFALAGCATVQGPPDPRDPWEGYNRAVFEFNDAVDRAVLRPVAEGYRAVTPRAVDEGVSNFFSNIDDLRVALYDLLQLKFDEAARDLGRVAWNSTVGLAGVFDVASSLGLPKRDEDFGQVLGHWGVPAGPYFVIPFLGPSTLRDAPSTYVDYRASPSFALWDEPESWYLTGLSVIDKRADLLPLEDLTQEMSYDRYAFLRDAFLQRRRYLVYDGNPPQEEDPLLKELQELEDQGL